ncbi:HD family hydrolase [Leminorella grimontii]|uniref:HD family hydrolase n=1 Tax=Leminorella grimontii TaxID=82981 RepID=UPI00208A0121|nr:HD family hydrolase [Leminorella grimontii]GKX61285.1 hypothetical protein SOASR031_36000 [Leminorella grimontii]
MTWLTTLSGRHFDYSSPTIDAICITDIAQGLSLECRFAGQLHVFYSVAQHSVLVSHLVPPAYALEALLHDATEAYCKDLPSPLKHLLPDYQRVENHIDSVIRHGFGLPAFMSSEVKRADLIALATERRDLELDDGKDWPILTGIVPAAMRIIPWTSYEAHHAFMDRFYELKAGVRAEA